MQDLPGPMANPAGSVYGTWRHCRQSSPVRFPLTADRNSLASKQEHGKYRGAEPLLFTPVSSLLIKHATVLATMDDAGTEIGDGGLYAVDGWIEQVGPTSGLPEDADEVLDLSGHVVPLPEQGGNGEPAKDGGGAPTGS